MLSQKFVQQNTKELVKKLDIGDKIKGQIIENNSDSIVIKLVDGSLLKAATMLKINAKQGEFVEFTVVDKKNSQIFLERSPSKIVESNISKTSVQTNRENAVNTQNTNFQDLSDSEVLNDFVKGQLQELGFEITERNIKVASEILTKGLVLNKENMEKALNLLENFKELNPAKAVLLLANNMPAEEKNIEGLIKIIDEKYQIGSKLNELIGELSGSQNKNVLDRIKLLFEESSLNKNKNMLLNEEQEHVINNVLKEVESNDGIIKQNIINQDQKQNINTTKNVESSLEKNQSNLLNQTNELKNELKNLLQKEFEFFFLKPDNDSIGKDIKLKDIYENAFDKLEIIKNAIDTNDMIGKDNILNKINDLQNSLRIINELNNHNTYIQIPLKMTDKETTGELYILKRGRGRKKIDPESTTMLISLETENLGQVDSLISVDKKNLSMSLKLSDNEIIEFFKQNIYMLYNALNEKKFKIVDVKYGLLQNKIDIENIEKELAKEFQEERKKFDIKI